MNECVDIFEVASRDSLQDTMNRVLIFGDLWNTWWNVFELYKNGSLACSTNSIMKDDFV